MWRHGQVLWMWRHGQRSLRAHTRQPTGTGVMSNWLGLRDKVCVVTGAASGIGRAIALAFAAGGAKIAALDRDGDGCARTVDEAKRAGADAAATVCDVTDAAAVAGAALQITRAFGR